MPRRNRRGERYLLASGAVLPGKEPYLILDHLGEGSFAVAYKAQNPAGQVCFIKEYLPPSRPSEAGDLARVYATEREVVRRIGNYELIPRFWDAFTHEGFSYLVTDYVPGPDLESLLAAGRKPPIDQLVQWCVCLCQELAFLHGRNVVHHDLKPANIRLNADGDPVIVDFSAAHWYRQPGETTDLLYGSDSYLAPEYAERSQEDAAAGMQMDVFAMGRILVELIVGERLTQEEIDARHDQLYGAILHSGQLDVSFVRAVFRAVAYDPARRYASGVELAEDILPAAPPVGRCRPASIDFGTVSQGQPLEVTIQCYNAGGGTLRADIAVEGDWLEIGTTGAVTGRSALFERNRQTVRVVAFPERIPPGRTAYGRVVFTFPGLTTQVPVSLQRSMRVAEVKVQPGSLRLSASPGGIGQARLTFTNQGNAPARVRIIPPVNLALSVAPEELVVSPGARDEVVVTVDSSVLGEAEIDAELRWTVEENPRAPIPVNAAVRRGGGLLTALSGRLRKR